MKSDIMKSYHLSTTKTYANYMYSITLTFILYIICNRVKNHDTLVLPVTLHSNDSQNHNSYSTTHTHTPLRVKPSMAALSQTARSPLALSMSIHRSRAHSSSSRYHITLSRGIAESRIVRSCNMNSIAPREDPRSSIHPFSTAVVFVPLKGISPAHSTFRACELCVHTTDLTCCVCCAITHIHTRDLYGFCI